MQGSQTGVAYQPLSWMELGEVPSAVKAWQANRLKTALAIGGIGGALLIGGLAGFASNAIWSGSGLFTWNLPLFFLVAIPGGIGSFFFTRWYLPWLVKSTQFQVRRIAISDDKLHLEQVSSKLVEWPLKRVRVSNEPRAGGWYVVSLPAGRTNISFWAPPMIASSIRAAATR